MTNVLAPYSEGQIIYSGYSKSNMLNSSISFIIPVYDNMPELPCISPAINSKDFTTENTKVRVVASSGLNLRTGPRNILRNINYNSKWTNYDKNSKRKTKR